LKILISRLNKHGNNPTFKRLSERLEAIRDKAEKGLINSIEFIKELCQLAKETLQAEKGTEPEVEQKNAKAALTELFLELKTDTTPAIVERIVNDIDEIVRVVRFDGWQNSTVGERDRRPACNTGLAKVAVQCSADTFVVNQSLVLRINICGENRHLRQARNNFSDNRK
jgi:type I restriction enzyme R subunit